MTNVPGRGPILLRSEVELKAAEDRIQAAIRRLAENGVTDAPSRLIDIDDEIEGIMQDIATLANDFAEKEVAEALNVSTGATGNAEGRAAFWEAEAKRLGWTRDETRTPANTQRPPAEESR